MEFGRIAAIVAGVLACGGVALAQSEGTPLIDSSRLVRADFEKVSSDEPGATLEVSGNGCVLVNNVWDAKAVPAGFSQSIFLERHGNGMVPGWQWNVPTPGPAVLSMPEMICGDKPWDAPRNLRRDFPFRAGEKAPSVTFDAGLEATGRYNMAFSLWAVSKLPAVQKTISLEIMIWTVNSGQTPSGEIVGTLEAAGTTFDLYYKKDQGMVTGPDPFTWPLAQFVARKPFAKGRIDFALFLDELLKRQILVRGHYLTNVELGTEVWEGHGKVTLKTFDLTLP